MTPAKSTPKPSIDRILEIVARVDAASPGPWAAPTTDADAEFLAHAREDVPFLLAEIVRLRCSRGAR